MIGCGAQGQRNAEILVGLHRLVDVIYVNDIKIDTSISCVVIVNRVLAGICLFVSDDVKLLWV